MSKTFMGRALLALLAAIAASFFLAPVGARADTEAAPSAKPAAAKSPFEEAMEKGAAAVEAEGKDPKADRPSFELPPEPKRSTAPPAKNPYGPDDDGYFDILSIFKGNK